MARNTNEPPTRRSKSIPSSSPSDQAVSSTLPPKDVERWHRRIRAASKAHGEWMEQYRCSDLEDFWKGNQWLHQTTGADTGAYGLADEKYVINLCFPGVEVKIPSLLFYHPKIKVNLRPPFSSDPTSDSPARMELLENTGNTFISDSRNNFQEETVLALREAFFRYGVIQVGYSADFIDNPNADRPMLRDDLTPYTDDDGAEIKEPAKVIKKDTEKVFIKRISAKRFIVSLNSGNNLGQCDWCGYYEWKYVSDLKADKTLVNTEDLKPTGRYSKEYKGEDEEVEIKGDTILRRGMCKVWYVWDNRTLERFIVVDGHPKYLMEPAAYEFLPFPGLLSFHPILDEPYPLPPMYNWLHPQMEQNEIREMEKVHRRRSYRRYTYLDGSIDLDQIKKLESGGDLAYAKANVRDPIVPVPDAPLDASIYRILGPQAKQDFYEISATSGEQFNVASSETATQASIIDTRSRIRESYMRYRVAVWLGEISILILKTMHRYCQLSWWIKKNIDPLSQAAEIQKQGMRALWQEIRSEDMGEMNYEVSVDMESLSPVSEDLKRQQWTAAMSSIFSTPISMMVMASSEVLLKKQLAFFDIRDARDISEIQKSLQAVLGALQQQQQAAAQAKMGGSPGPPGTPGTPSASPAGTPADTVMAHILSSVQAMAPGAPAPNRPA